MKFQLWMEGYRVQEASEGAKHLGEFEGSTFEDACRAWNETQEPRLRSYFGEHGGRPAWWGQRIFDNEADARKFLG